MKKLVPLIVLTVLLVGCNNKILLNNKDTNYIEKKDEMISAIRKGDNKRIITLVNNNSVDLNSEPYVAYAIKFQKLNTLKYLLENDASTDNYSISYSKIKLPHNYTAFAKFSIKKEANDSLLNYAIKKQRSNSYIKLLIEYNVKFDEKEYPSFLIKLNNFLRYSLKVKTKDKNYIEKELRNNNINNVLIFLIKNDYYIFNITHSTELTYLYDAISKNKTQIVKKILNENQDIDINRNDNPSAITPLISAVSQPTTNINIIETLINHGADIEKTVVGENALNIAKARKDIKVIKLLQNANK